MLILICSPQPLIVQNWPNFSLEIGPATLLKSHPHIIVLKSLHLRISMKKKGENTGLSLLPQDVQLL
jgi:hypothetical protein